MYVQVSGWVLGGKVAHSWEKGVLDMVGGGWGEDKGGLMSVFD